MTAAALTAQDAHNALIFLDRVQTTGVQEAQVLALLAHKLRAICEEKPAHSTHETKDVDRGEDRPSTTE